MVDLNLDPKSTALLPLHFHNYLVANNPMARQRNLVARARRVLDGARQAGLTIIHAEIRRRPGFVSPRNKFVRVVRDRIPYPINVGDPAEAMKFVAGLEPVGDEVVLHGAGINVFYGSELQPLLTTRDITTVAIMGVVTEFVVEATARYAVDANYRVLIIEDCCVGFTEEAHKASIAVLDWMTEICSSADFLESIGQPT